LLSRQETRSVEGNVMVGEHLLDLLFCCCTSLPYHDLNGDWFCCIQLVHDMWGNKKDMGPSATPVYLTRIVPSPHILMRKQSLLQQHKANLWRQQTGPRILNLKVVGHET